MPDPWAGRRKLLAVADVQTGYHHDAISHTLSTLERIGRSSGDYVTNIRTDSQLITRQPIVGVGTKYGGKPVNAKGLSHYDALFLLPSGAGTLSEQQKADLLAFVHDDGKGLLIGHAGMIAFYDWPDYTKLTGCRMGGEFMATSTVQVADPAFPGARAFGGAPFPFKEQHPILKEPYLAESVHVVLRLDASSIDSGQRNLRADGDYPVAWTVDYGKGRVYNLGWGHLEETWDDPRFQEMIRGAIQWAMGPARSPA